MLSVFRFRSLVVVLGLVLGLVAVGLMSPGRGLAQDAEPGGPCAATGYLVRSDTELAGLREGLAEQGVHEADGVPLDRVQTWVVPDGSRPVVVLDSAAPVLSGGAAAVTLAGQEFRVSTVDFPQAQDRYVSSVEMPHLGSTVRSLGYTVSSGPCEVAVALSVDRSVWSTAVGGASAGLAVLGGLALVLVARLRRGGWGRRFGFAAPLGLLAGSGLAGVLLEGGVVSPFGVPPWWAPVAGLGLAALLPLTR